MTNRIRWTLTISGGILAGIPWWGTYWPFLLICFVPLLLVEDDLRNKGEGSLSVLPFSFVFFLVWNIIVTWWMARIHLVGGISVIIINAALMSIVFLLYAVIKKNTGRGVVIFIILWTAFEYLHHRGDLSWPWLSLGNGLAADVRIIQWYEYTGMPGGSVWVLISNGFIYALIRRYLDNLSSPGLHMHIALLTGILVFPPAVSLYVFNSYEDVDDKAGFLIVQPVVDPYGDKFSGKSNSQKLDQILNMAERNIEEEVDFIITPETSVDSIWVNHPGDSLISQIKGFTARHPGAVLVMGATSFIYVDRSENAVTARMDDRGAYFEVRNSALYFASGSYLGAYHKHYLANGVEQIPFQRYIRFMERFSVDLGGVSGSLKPGKGPEVFRSPFKDNLITGTLICFESSYGEYAASMAEEGAEIIIVISNDGWFKNTGAYMQHLRLSLIRAVETRRDIVRAANTGISCHISGRGEIIEKTGWWEESSLMVHPARNKSKTLYTRSGNYLGRTAIFFSLLLLLDLIIRRYVSWNR